MNASFHKLSILNRHASTQRAAPVHFSQVPFCLKLFQIYLECLCLSDTQSYVLNFHGRVTQASVKNFQIVHDNDGELSHAFNV